MDENELLKLFIGDSEEHLQIISSSLLVLEESPGDQAAIDEIFRAAHSIKGCSATIGFNRMAALTHEMESLLDAIRGGAAELGRECVDTLFNCLDTLNAMLEKISVERSDEVDYSDVYEELKAFTGCLVETEAPAVEFDDGIDAAGEALIRILRNLSDFDRLAIEEELRQKSEVFEIIVGLSDRDGMESVRCMVMLNNLRAIGDILKCAPDPESEDAPDSFDRIHVLLATDADDERVREQLGEVGIAYVEIFPASIYMWTLDNSAEEAPAESGPAPGAAEAAATPDDSAAPNNGGARKPNDRKDAAADSGRSLSTVRVDTARLDSIMNLVGELVITRTQLAEVKKSLLAVESDPEVNGDARAALQRIKNINGKFDNVFQHIGRISTELQDRVMQIRLLPISTVFSRFGRVVRDLSAQLGREVDVVVTGENTELDKTVIEAIGDPLIHIVRNAVAHGIEPPDEREAAGKSPRGVLSLDARHAGNHVLITVADDGRGLDRDKILRRAVETGVIEPGMADSLTEQEIMNLIFEPGFSTADEVDDISGRGVGLDVAARNIERLNGLVEAHSRPGLGTTFILRIPLTLAIIQALLVDAAGETFAVPLGNIVEALRIQPSDINTIEGREAMMLRGRVLSLLRVDEILGLPPAAERNRRLFVVVVGYGEKQIGLIVDRLIGRQEIVVKSLDDCFSDVPAVAGASILGDGSVSLILDVFSLVETGMRSMARGAKRKKRSAKQKAEASDSAVEKA